MATTDQQLRTRLRVAPSGELLRLVEEHLGGFGIGEVRAVLLNPYVTGDVIRELRASRSLTTIYEVKAALARHHRTPEAGALSLLSALFWRDLLEISIDTRIRASVRRTAERYLLRRLSRLAIGEKIALARRAGPEILAVLRHDPSLRVLEAVLESPRLTETTLLPLLGDDRASPRHLDLVARHPRWGRRYPVRKALSRRPKSPFRVLFDILEDLRPADLSAVAELEAHSAIVREKAREILEDRPDAGVADSSGVVRLPPIEEREVAPDPGPAASFDPPEPQE